jgi:hypothetical protein
MMAFSLGFPAPTIARIALACHPARSAPNSAAEQKLTQ